MTFFIGTIAGILIGIVAMKGGKCAPILGLLIGVSGGLLAKYLEGR